MSIDLSAMRSRLVTLRNEYIFQIGEIAHDLEEKAINTDDATGDLEDAAQEIYSEELSQGEVENLRMNLQLIDEALARIENDTYGICLECGNPIDDKRLEVIPYARYCLTDQVKHEE